MQKGQRIAGLFVRCSTVLTPRSSAPQNLRWITRRIIFSTGCLPRLRGHQRRVSSGGPHDVFLSPKPLPCTSSLAQDSRITRAYQRKKAGQLIRPFRAAFYRLLMMRTQERGTRGHLLLCLLRSLLLLHTQGRLLPHCFRRLMHFSHDYLLPRITGHLAI